MNDFSMAQLDGFFEAVLKLKTVEDCRKFFEDVCTIKELLAIDQRLQVAKLLSAGESYQEVCKKTGASSATISRVSKCLGYGAGGYELVLDKEAE